MDGKTEAELCDKTIMLRGDPASDPRPFVGDLKATGTPVLLHLRYWAPLVLCLLHVGGMALHQHKGYTWLYCDGLGLNPQYLQGMVVYFFVPLLPCLSITVLKRFGSQAIASEIQPGLWCMDFGSWLHPGKGL